MITVLGLPSGGTSVVAGMLHHLGVDMGHLITAEQQKSIPDARQYYGYECSNLVRLMNHATNLDDWFQRFEGYAKRRIAREEGHIGVKNNRVAFLGDHARLTELPITVVHVKRSLEDTFASDYRHTGSLNRGATLGSLYVCMLRFLERIPPKVTVQYEGILENPGWNARQLNYFLELNASKKQQADACAVVQPINRGKI